MDDNNFQHLDIIDNTMIHYEDLCGTVCVVLVHLAVWVRQSLVEGPAQGPHSLMQGVRGVAHDRCQFGKHPPLPHPFY